MKTINITFKLDESQINNFDNWFRSQVEVIDFKILPDTEKLYSEDSHFKALVKSVKDAQRIRDQYINEHNYGESIKKDR
jgi:hypothetical protein